MRDLKTRPMRRVSTLPNLAKAFTSKDQAPPKKNLTMDAARLDAFSKDTRPRSFRIEHKSNKVDPGVEVNRRLLETQMIKKLKEGVLTEGIFRKSGNESTVKAMAEMLNNGEIKPWPSDDVIEIAAAYKGFLRLRQNAGNPLLSESDFTRLRTAYQDETSVKRRLFAFKAVFRAMSPDNALRFKEYLMLMAHTAQHSDVNKMTAHNLAIVTAPNLFPAALDPLSALNEMQAHLDLIESLIMDSLGGHFDRL